MNSANLLQVLQSETAPVNIAWQLAHPVDHPPGMIARDRRRALARIETAAIMGYTRP
jgi:hypothetical protein